MKKVIITTSWDDGHPLDLKLAELLLRYNVPATFYIPVKNIGRPCLTATELIQIARNFDIGGHAYHHTDLTRLSQAEARQEITRGKDTLENIIGRSLYTFCYPMGRYNTFLKRIVQTAGFRGARTTKPLKRRITDPFQAGTLVQAHDFPRSHYIMTALESMDAGLTGYILKKSLYAEKWDRIAIKTLEYIVKHGGVWHLWGHSWEIDAHDNWRRLTHVLQEIKRLSGQIEKVDNSRLVEMLFSRQPVSEVARDRN